MNTPIEPEVTLPVSAVAALWRLWDAYWFTVGTYDSDVQDMSLIGTYDVKLLDELSEQAELHAATVHNALVAAGADL